MQTNDPQFSNPDDEQRHEPEFLKQAQEEVRQGSTPWYHVIRWTRILVFTYLIIFLVFTSLAVLAAIFPVWPFDVRVTRELQEEQSPVLMFIMQAVSWPGNVAFVSAGMVLLTALIFWFLRLRLEALFIVGLTVVSFLCNITLKYIVSRPRPTVNLVEVVNQAGGQSFPSGHVMGYMAFWGLLFSFTIILFKRDRWWQYLLLIVSAFFMIMVGPSRIYLGNHWASDVIGGYLFSLLLLGLTLWLYIKLKQRGVLEASEHPRHYRFINVKRSTAKHTS